MRHLAALYSIAFLFAGVISSASAVVVGSVQQSGVSWFIHDTPPKLVRYDLTNQQWLADIVLPSARGTATAFHVDADGIYVAYGTAVYRYNLSGAAETHLVNVANAVSALHTDGNLLFVNHSDSNYARFSSVKKSANTQIATFEKYTDSVVGSSIAPTANKMFGRTLGISPADITYVSYTNAGAFTVGGESPYHGDYPSATKTWVFPNDARVADNSGTVYGTGDLTYAGSFGGVITDIAFHGLDIPIVLRNSELISYTSTLLPAGSKTLGYSPFEIAVSGVNVTTFTVDAVEASGIKARTVPLTELAAPTPGQPVTAAGLPFTPDHIFQDVNGIVHLLHKGSQSIFRWDPATQRYLTTIALIGIPSFAAYSAPLHRVYLAYPSGLIRKIDLSDTNFTETAFHVLPSAPLGLSCAGQYLFASDGSGAWNTHYSIGPTGTLVDSEDRNYYSESYAWSEANQKMYFFSDDTSPNDLLWEEINANGTAYAGEVQGAIRNKIDSPLHGADSFVHPIRIAPNGSVVIIGTGKLYNGLTLARETNALPNAIADAAWLNGQLRTVRTITSSTQYQQWTGTTYASGIVKQYPGTAHRLLNHGTSTTELIGISIPTDGRPSFYKLDSSFEVIAPAALEKPGFLTATSVSATQTVFSWADVSGETAYLIERKTGVGGAWAQVGTATVSNTSYTDTTVSLGNEYYYRVIAQNGPLLSPSSEELYMPVTAPPVPTSLVAVANSYSAITVTWSDVMLETGYKLEYATASTGPWTQATAPAANATSYQFNSLSQSTAYFFRIRSSNQIGDSAYSTTASATTLAAPPSAPSFYVSSAAYNRVILAWYDVAYEDSYVIERAPGDTSTWQALTTVLTNVTTYTDNTVTASTSYSYRIKAVNTAGSSAWSTTNATTPAPTPPAVPGGIALRVISSSQLRLTWADVADETSYQIERRTDDPLSWALLTSVPAGTTLYDDLGVVGGIQYWYRIKSVNAHGSSAASAVVTGTPLNIYRHVQDDFDPTPEGSLWASITSGAATNGGVGFLGSNALWFGASGTRSATTVPLNFLMAGYVEFSFRAGNQNVDGATYWNNSESGESVVIEYSLDGVTWTTFQTLNTLYPSHSTWTNYFLPVPAAALTSTTRLRWRQTAHSGATNDTWALEDVSIHSDTPISTNGPEIELREATANLSSGFSTVSYGSINAELTSTKTFTLKNTGNQPLTGVAVTVTGGHAADFTLGSVPATLAAGSEVSFDLIFDPQATGARGASLSIASNDSDENPFIVALTGYGTTNAQIVVESPPGSALSSGVSTIHFGNVLLYSYNQQTVTLRNSGTAPLTQIAISVINGGVISLGRTALGVTTLAPGASASFQVDYSPVAVGLHSATLRITSSDPEESPFNVQLTGSGRIAQAPSFTVQPNSQLALLGGSTSFSPVVSGDSPMTYQWRKGTAVIPGALQQSHTISITKAADVGVYSVTADNPVGVPVPSSAAYLGLVTPMSGEQILRIGSTLSLRCTAAAPTVSGVTLSYAWKRDDTILHVGTQPNGAVISGMDKAALTISKLGEDDSGIYTCYVTLTTPAGSEILANGEMQVHVVSAVPEVNPVPLSTLSVSQTIDELVTATNFPTAFSATGLPKGWKLDPKSGRITGKATEPSKKDVNGDYIPNIITIKASNPFGAGPGLPVPVVIEALDAGSTGSFYGFVARAGHSNFGMGGHVQLTIASTGVVTGSATLAGQRHSIAGVLDVPLDAAPTASLLIKRSPASLGNLIMDVQLLPNEQLLHGTILDPQFEIMPGGQTLGDPAESALVNGGMSAARFSSPKGIFLRADGTGYIADTGNHSIRFVNLEAGTVATFAGDGTAGIANGTGAAARFSSPEGLALDASGNLYVADTGNSTIRRITPAGLVTTIAGASGQTGFTNGLGLTARFNQPSGLCLDATGNLYVVDRANHTIRRINPAGTVTTFAGMAGVSGHKDGSGASALFNSPRGIAYDPVLKALFVTDSANQVIRKITLSGTVSTYAGSPGIPGFDDGPLLSARFESPLGITSLGNGTLVITDTVLRQINANGLVGTLSNRIDPADHPVDIAYNVSDKSLVVVHDSLHGASSHNAAGSAQNATFTARCASWSTTVPVTVPLVGIYNAALETSAAGDNLFPQGDGYAQLTITKTGAANWSGRSADGSAFTFGTFMSADYFIPLHAMLYKNTGSLQGECFIDSLSRDIASQASPGIDWYKIGQPLVSTERSYKAGFNTYPLRLFGGKYQPSDLHAYLSLATTPAPMQAVLSDSTISGFSQPFTLADPNTVSVPTNARGLTLLIDAKTGLFTGSFKEGSPSFVVPFAGILIDFNAESIKGGYGHYLLPVSAAKTAPIESSRIRLEAD